MRLCKAVLKTAKTTLHSKKQEQSSIPLTVGFECVSVFRNRADATKIDNVRDLSEISTRLGVFGESLRSTKTNLRTLRDQVTKVYCLHLYKGKDKLSSLIYIEYARVDSMDKPDLTADQLAWLSLDFQVLEYQIAKYRGQIVIDKGFEKKCHGLKLHSLFENALERPSRLFVLAFLGTKREHSRPNMCVYHFLNGGEGGQNSLWPYPKYSSTNAEPLAEDYQDDEDEYGSEAKEEVFKDREIGGVQRHEAARTKNNYISEIESYTGGNQSHKLSRQKQDLPRPGSGRIEERGVELFDTINHGHKPADLQKSQDKLSKIKQKAEKNRQEQSSRDDAKEKSPFVIVSQQGTNQTKRTVPLQEKLTKMNSKNDLKDKKPTGRKQYSPPSNNIDSHTSQVYDSTRHQPSSKLNNTPSTGSLPFLAAINRSQLQNTVSHKNQIGNSQRPEPLVEDCQDSLEESNAEADHTDQEPEVIDSPSENNLAEKEYQNTSSYNSKRQGKKGVVKKQEEVVDTNRGQEELEEGDEEGQEEYYIDDQEVEYSSHKMEDNQDDGEEVSREYHSKRTSAKDHRTKNVKLIEIATAMKLGSTALSGSQSQIIGNEHDANVSRQYPKYGTSNNYQTEERGLKTKEDIYGDQRNRSDYTTIQKILSKTLPRVNDNKTTAKMKILHLKDCNPPKHSDEGEASDAESSEDSIVDRVFRKANLKIPNSDQQNSKVYKVETSPKLLGSSQLRNLRTKYSTTPHFVTTSNTKISIHSPEDGDIGAEDERLGWSKVKLIGTLNNSNLQNKQLLASNVSLSEEVGEFKIAINLLREKTQNQKASLKETRMINKKITRELENVVHQNSQLLQHLSTQKDTANSLEEDLYRVKKELDIKSREVDSRGRDLARAKSQLNDTSQVYSSAKEEVTAIRKYTDNHIRELEGKLKMMESQYSNIQDQWTREKYHRNNLDQPKRELRQNVMT